MALSGQSTSWFLAVKEGGFVVLRCRLFTEKTSLAVEKNFKKARLKPQKVMSEAIKLLNEINLEKLVKEAREAKRHARRKDPEGETP